jgi:hypothetical protein
MKINRKALAVRLHADVNGPWLNIPGPGHKKADRSLGIFVDPSAPDGFRMHSLAGDDLDECRAYVKKLLAEVAINGSIHLSFEDDVVLHTKAEAHAAASRISAEAQPIADTLASAYLTSRTCAPFEGEPWPADLRFHPACPFRTFKFPALVALMRDVFTGEPTGIHRTALKDDGSGKREMPEGVPSKMMLGRAKHAAVMLHPAGLDLGIAEGIETALSAHQIFKMPVWAALSAGGIREFPIIHSIKFLRVFADHDEAGLSAARICKRRYEAAGIEVEVRYPPEFGSDWNDYLMKEY